MTIVQLGTFLKIAETRSFTSAAAMLGYAQSTVTTQIKQLEEELGCLLFDRLGKNVILTAEGEKLSAYAEKILQLSRACGTLQGAIYYARFAQAAADRNG